jgi:exopolysaccharide production protein ExoZ
MVFHYNMWLFGLFTTNTFLGKVGIYGVSVFFVLSGLTLFHVYHQKIGAPSKAGLIDFAIKRVFRIFPLIWLLTAATLLLKKDDYTTSGIVLNFTGLSSFIHWDDTIIYGAWSIGNEVTFYLFFPVFVFMSKRSRVLFGFFALAILMLYLWFTFIHMPKAIADGAFWATYTNPLNNVFLFLGGYLIGLFTRNIPVPKIISIPVAVIAFGVFIFLPVSGDATHLVAGWYRVIFSLLCMAICFAFYKTDFGLPRLLHKCFETLGEISYCLYLVHPLLWHVLTHYFGAYYSGLPAPVKMCSGFALSILIAYAIYQLFEKYFMKLGRRVAGRFANKAIVK